MITGTRPILHDGDLWCSWSPRCSGAEPGTLFLWLPLRTRNKPDDSRAGTQRWVEGVVGEERHPLLDDEGSAGVQLEEQMPRVLVPITGAV